MTAATAGAPEGVGDVHGRVPPRKRVCFRTVGAVTPSRGCRWDETGRSEVQEKKKSRIQSRAPPLSAFCSNSSHVSSGSFCSEKKKKRLKNGGQTSGFAPLEGKRWQYNVTKLNHHHHHLRPVLILLCDTEHFTPIPAQYKSPVRV